MPLLYSLVDHCLKVLIQHPSYITFHAIPEELCHHILRKQGSKIYHVHPPLHFVTTGAFKDRIDNFLYIVARYNLKKKVCDRETSEMIDYCIKHNYVIPTLTKEEQIQLQNNLLIIGLGWNHSEDDGVPLRLSTTISESWSSIFGAPIRDYAILLRPAMQEWKLLFFKVIMCNYCDKDSVMVFPTIIKSPDEMCMIRRQCRICRRIVV